MYFIVGFVSLGLHRERGGVFSECVGVMYGSWWMSAAG